MSSGILQSLWLGPVLVKLCLPQTTLWFYAHNLLVNIYCALSVVSREMIFAWISEVVNNRLKVFSTFCRRCRDYSDIMMREQITVLMYVPRKKKSHKQFCTYSLFKKIWKQRNFVFFRMLQLQSQAVNFGGKVALCIQTMNKLWFQYEMRTILCSKTDFFRFTSIHDQWAVLPLRMK